MALRRRLPLDHDGLVGPAAGNDVLWRGRGGLLGEGDPGEKSSETGWVFPLRLEGGRRRRMGARLHPALLRLATTVQSLCAFGRVA